MEEITVFFAVDAEQYLISGFPQEAIDLCRRGLEAYPDYSAAYTVLARAYKAMGEDDKAADILDKAAEKFSDKRLFEPAKRNLDFVPTFLNPTPTEESEPSASAGAQPSALPEQPDEIVIDLEAETIGIPDSEAESIEITASVETMESNDSEIETMALSDSETEENDLFESFMNEALAEAAERAEAAAGIGNDQVETGEDAIDLDSMLDSFESDEIALDPSEDSIDDADNSIAAEQITDTDFAPAESSLAQAEDLFVGQAEEELTEQPDEFHAEQTEVVIADQVEDESSNPMADFDSLMADEIDEPKPNNPEALDYIDQALAFNTGVMASDLSDEFAPSEPLAGGIDAVEEEINLASETEEQQPEADFAENIDFEEFAEIESSTEVETATDESDAPAGGNFILRAVNLAPGEEDDSRELRAGNLSLIPGLDFSPLKSGIRRATHRPIGQDLDFPPFDFELEEAEESAVAAFIPEPIESAETDRAAGGFNFSELAAQLESVSLPKPRAAVAEVNEDAHESGFASETMAFIYEQQGAWEAALDSYRKLLAAKPERADFYIERIENIEGNIKLRGIDR